MREENKRMKVDEMIEAITAWNKKYPKAPIGIRNDKKDIAEELRSYVGYDAKESRKLIEEYRALRSKYDYLRLRRGMLTYDQLNACKEADMRGVFGNTSTVEQLALKYRISEKKINYIIDTYGSFDKFLSAYFSNNLTVRDEVMLEDNLKRAFDVYENSNPVYSRIYFDMMRSDRTFNTQSIGIFSSKELMDTLNKMHITSKPNESDLSFTARHRDLYLQRYDIKNLKVNTYKDIAKPRVIGPERIRQLMIAMNGIIRKELGTQLFEVGQKGRVVIPEEMALRVDKIKNMIFSSNYIFYPDDEYRDLPVDLDFDSLIREYESLIKDFDKYYTEQKLKEGDEKERGIRTDDSFASLENLDIPLSTYVVLVYNGIYSYKKLLEEYQNGSLEGMLNEERYKLVASEIEKIESRNVKITSKKIVRPKEDEIKNIGLSGATYNALMRSGIRSKEQLMSMSEEDLLKFRGIGPKAVTEIMKAISDLKNHSIEEVKDVTKDVGDVAKVMGELMDLAITEENNIEH